MADTLTQVRMAAGKRLEFGPHADKRMAQQEPALTKADSVSGRSERASLQEAIQNGQIIEDYPEDLRGHSCLLCGYGFDNRPVHIVCSPKATFLFVITAYVPDSARWDSEFRRRIT